MDFKWLFFSYTEAWPFSLDSPTGLHLEWEKEGEKGRGREGRERSVAHPTSQLQISKDNEGIHKNEWRKRKTNIGGGWNDDKVIVKGGEESMVCGKTFGRERGAKADNGGLSPSFWTGDPGREGVGGRAEPQTEALTVGMGSGWLPQSGCSFGGGWRVGGGCEGAASHGRSRSAGHTHRLRALALTQPCQPARDGASQWSTNRYICHDTLSVQRRGGPRAHTHIAQASSAEEERVWIFSPIQKPHTQMCVRMGIINFGSNFINDFNDSYPNFEGKRTEYDWRKIVLALSNLLGQIMRSF